MKLSFVWYWDRAAEIYPNWRDGLRAAVEELSKRHSVSIYLNEEPKEDSDWILFWGDSNDPFFSKLDNYSAKKGIILTTDPHNFDNLRRLDVVFCESTPVYEAVRRAGIHAVKAFGTDTNFYKPSQSVAKDIPYFYPATFSPWKKQSDIAALGKELVCIGTVQPDGVKELEACKVSGVNIAEGYFAPEWIREYYNRARFVPIPAIHGSERTVLEAMSMNIVPSVNPQNKRTISYVEEYIHSGCITPRQFVLQYYSPEVYAKAIEKGFE